MNYNVGLTHLHRLEADGSQKESLKTLDVAKVIGEAIR